MLILEFSKVEVKSFGPDLLTEAVELEDFDDMDDIDDMGTDDLETGVVGDAACKGCWDLYRCCCSCSLANRCFSSIERLTCK